MPFRLCQRSGCLVNRSKSSAECVAMNCRPARSLMPRNGSTVRSVTSWPRALSDRPRPTNGCTSPIEPTGVKRKRPGWRARSDGIVSRGDRISAAHAEGLRGERYEIQSSGIPIRQARAPEESAEIAAASVQRALCSRWLPRPREKTAIRAGLERDYLNTTSKLITSSTLILGSSPRFGLPGCSTCRWLDHSSKLI